MIEYMIIALIIAKFCEKGAIDITSMITGNQPPSKTFQAAKGTTAEAGPLGKFFKAWYADAIEDLDEKRRIKRLETKEEQDRARAERKADRQRILDAIDEKAKADKAEREEREPADDIPVEEPPDPRDSEAGEPLPVDEGPGEKDRNFWGDDLPERNPWEERPEQTIPDPPRGEDPEDEPQATAEPDEPRQVQDLEEEIFDADLVEDKTPEIPQGPEGPKVPEFKVIEGTVERPEDDAEWRPYSTGPQLYAVPDQEGETGMVETDSHGYAKTPFQKRAGTVTAMAAATMGANGMTTQAVAIEGGITQHIGWTAAVADYQVQAANHVEMVAAMMFQGENGPARLALVARIQEGHRILREMYLQLNAALVNDKNLVGDAYAATGGQAGGKPYVTN
jgi:hypothetical protein